MKKWEKAGQGKRKKAGQRKRDRKTTNLRDLLCDPKMENYRRMKGQNNDYNSSV